jgi:hypothetical protein
MRKKSLEFLRSLRRRRKKRLGGREERNQNENVEYSGATSSAQPSR